jgi:hypothetical protein
MRRPPYLSCATAVVRAPALARVNASDAASPRSTCEVFWGRGQTRVGHNSIKTGHFSVQTANYPSHACARFAASAR